jgi:dipeptidyl aminopeptidase/acylaminoacyl peptidase
MKSALRSGLAVACLASAAAAQDRAQLQYDSAYFAWDAGNYVDALNRLQRVLNGPNGERFFEPAALLTGELFHTTEIAPPSRYVVSITGSQAPKWSPDGRNFVFESTAGPVRTAHVYHWGNGDTKVLAQMNGYSVSFSADASRVVFLRVSEDDELRAARAAQGGGRGGRGGGGAALAALEAAKAMVVVRDLASGAKLCSRHRASRASQ